MVRRTDWRGLSDRAFARLDLSECGSASTESGCFAYVGRRRAVLRADAGGRGQAAASQGAAGALYIARSISTYCAIGMRPTAARRASRPAESSTGYRTRRPSFTSNCEP